MTVTPSGIPWLFPFPPSGGVIRRKGDRTVSVWVSDLKRSSRVGSFFRCGTELVVLKNEERRFVGKAGQMDVRFSLAADGDAGGRNGEGKERFALLFYVYPDGTHCGFSLFYGFARGMDLPLR